MNGFRRIALSLIAAAAAAGALAPGALAAAGTVVFNLDSGPKVEPARIFFQANSGPYLDGLRWTGWGAEGAVGTGSYVLDCSNGGSACGASTAVTRYPARYTLTELVPCARLGAGAMTYRTGTVEIDKPTGTEKTRFDPDEDFCAKRPTATAAKIAVKRYVLKRAPSARTFTITCRITGATDLECKARWTQGGKRRVRSYGVFGELTGPPHVIPFGS